MNRITIEKLEQFFQDNELLRGIPSDEAEVEAAEQQLAVSFNVDYKQFIHLFGGSMLVYVPIYGLQNSEVMESSSVVEVSLSFRQDNWPGTENTYVFSVDQSGNPLTIDNQGQVITFDHDAGEVYVLSASFEAFILSLIS